MYERDIEKVLENQIRYLERLLETKMSDLRDITCDAGPLSLTSLEKYVKEEASRRVAEAKIEAEKTKAKDIFLDELRISDSQKDEAAALLLEKCEAEILKELQVAETRVVTIIRLTLKNETTNNALREEELKNSRLQNDLNITTEELRKALLPKRWWWQK